MNDKEIEERQKKFRREAEATIKTNIDSVLSIKSYKWMAFRKDSGQVFAWLRSKDMRTELPKLGGEFDIFKKVRQKVCRKGLVLEHEEGFNKEIEKDF